MVLNRNHKKDDKNISKNGNNHHVNRFILSKWKKRLSNYLSKIVKLISCLQDTYLKPNQQNVEIRSIKQKYAMLILTKKMLVKQNNIK